MISSIYFEAKRSILECEFNNEIPPLQETFGGNGQAATDGSHGSVSIARHNFAETVEKVRCQRS